MLMEHLCVRALDPLDVKLNMLMEISMGQTLVCNFCWNCGYFEII
ncbi:hypothetical protein HanPSC8_Chr16g0708661 [Helianthus annuus]|nr:hypothetical protein HanIR_Chr16g0803451 [Helianthus annuus]KAJ0820492.1 hypothetical protein HanPSC8_Chr16g0708661 [Helianthus annuus]